MEILNKDYEIVCSVVIGVRNGEKYIGRAIDSIICQTYTAWKLIIVDDGSTDNTASIINSYNDKRIRYIHQNAFGVSSARNKGIENACGKYIVFLDADDTLVPESLSVRVKDMNNHNAKMGWYSHIQCLADGTKTLCCSDDFSIETAVDFLSRAKNFQAGRTTGLEYVWDKIFDLDTIKKKSICFDITMDRFEDWRFVLSFLSANCNVYVSPVSCMIYNIHTESVSHSKDDFLYEKTERYWKILYKHLIDNNIQDQAVWEGFYHGYLNKIIGIFLGSDDKEKAILTDKLKKSGLFSVGIKNYRIRNDKESLDSLKDLFDLR